MQALLTDRKGFCKFMLVAYPPPPEIHMSEIQPSALPKLFSEDEIARSRERANPYIKRLVFVRHGPPDEDGLVRYQEVL